MESFLELLVKKILFENDTISTKWIVLPSNRAIVYTKHYFKKLNTKSAWLPNIVTIDDFIKQYANLSSVSSIELSLLFFDVYLDMEKEKAETIDKFMNWAPMLLADFNEIDHYLLDHHTVFNDLKNIKEIDHWSFGEKDLSELQEKTLSFWNKIPLYYERLNEKLQEKKLGYNGKIYKWVANSIFEVLQDFEDSSVYFAGFNALSNSERHIIQTFVSSGKGIYLIDGDPFYVNNKQHEAGYFIRKHQKMDFLNSKNWIEDHFKTLPKNIEIVSASSNIIQAKFCGELLHKMNPEDIKKTAIVLCDEQLLLPLLNSFPNTIEAYNISMGYNLFNSPLGNLVQHIFNAQLNLEKFNRQLHYNSFFSVIDHYFLNAKVSTSTLKQEIIKRNKLFLSPKYLASQEELKSIQFLFTPWEASHLFFDAKQCFYQLIAFLKNRFNPNEHSLELEYLFEFEKLVKKIDTALGDKNYIKSLSTIKNLFYQLLKSESVSFIGEPLDGLQIIGTLETRSLDFENIIMLSVNDDVMPRSSSENSYIPYELKKLYGLPTYKEKEAIYAHHFYRLLQRAKNIHLVYNESTEGVGGSEKSRYLNQIIYELPVYNNHIKVSEVVIENEIEVTPLHPITIKHEKSIEEKLLLLNEKGFSPTALRTLINCSLDFYYKYIIGLRAEEEVNETIEANTLGNIMHEVLEKLYTDFVGKTLTPAAIDKMLLEFEPLLIEEFRNQYATDFEHGKNYLLFYASKKTIEQFLKTEKKLVEKHVLTIIALEKEYSREIPVLINQEEKLIRLRGTIDRIDSLDGKIRLIDYKTGKVDPKSINLDKLAYVFSNPKKEKVFQLLLYYYLVLPHFESEEIMPGIISFKSIGLGLIPLNINPIKNLTTEYEAHMKELIAQLFYDTFSFVHNEKSSYCVYC